MYLCMYACGPQVETLSNLMLVTCILVRINCRCIINDKLFWDNCFLPDTHTHTLYWCERSVASGQLSVGVRDTWESESERKRGQQVPRWPIGHLWLFFSPTTAATILYNYIRIYIYTLAKWRGGNRENNDDDFDPLSCRFHLLLLH